MSDVVRVAITEVVIVVLSFSMGYLSGLCRKSETRAAEYKRDVEYLNASLGHIERQQDKQERRLAAVELRLTDQPVPDQL